MPNGRHGAVLVAREDLVSLFQSLDADLAAGTIAGRKVVVRDVLELLAREPSREVFLEGQDEFLVVHLDPKNWLWVDQDCPTHPGLLELRMEWLKRPRETDSEAWARRLDESDSRRAALIRWSIGVAAVLLLLFVLFRL